jgi:hypothetical protein
VMSRYYQEQRARWLGESGGEGDRGGDVAAVEGKQERSVASPQTSVPGGERSEGEHAGCCGGQVEMEGGRVEVDWSYERDQACVAAAKWAIVPKTLPSATSPRPVLLLRDSAHLLDLDGSGDRCVAEQRASRRDRTAVSSAPTPKKERDTRSGACSAG